MLNFPSDALLLHPAGYMVSINSRDHKVETLRIPKAPMAVIFWEDKPICGRSKFTICVRQNI